MSDYMDELLREAYRDSAEITEGMEEAVASKMTDQKKQKRNIFRMSSVKGMRLRPVFMVFCGILLLGSAITAYGAAKGLSVDQLFAVIWGERQQKNSLEQFGTEVDVLSEKSTFQNIDIEPVQAISDGQVTYVVMKVEGKNGFRLTDEMTFDVFSLDDAEKSTDSLNSYVLKREGNTMYVALWSRMEKTKEAQQKYSIDIYNLYHAELDEMGKNSKVKHTVTEPGEEDKTSYLRYTEESIAAKGEYHGKILCSVQGNQLEITTEEFGTFQIRALSVMTTQDISEEVGLVDAGEKDNTVYVLMEDGNEVQAIFSGGQRENCTFELREPVDLKKVKGIRVLGHDYSK